MSIQADIKLLFIDLDGTSLSSDLELSDRNICALRCAAESGVHVVLASGRPAESVLAYAALIGVVQYVIAANGSATIESATRRVLDYSELSTRAAIRIPEIARHNRVTVCMYTPLEWFVYGINHHVDIEIGRSKTRPIIVESFIDLTLPKIKAMLIGEQPNLALCELELSKDQDLGIKWFYTYPEYIDLIPHEASKGRACRQLAERLGVKSESIMAIGDGVNDVEMIQAANVRVAVANASPELLSCADYVAPTNDQDGVAIAIEELVMKNGSELLRLSHSPQARSK